MIWVIGDIHGMIKPLERTLSAIEEYNKNEEKTQKIIFIGDYVDFGLNSKEVLDTLIDLPYPTVFLMGNHDDLAVRFHKKVDLNHDYSYFLYLKDTQGSYETLRSLLNGHNAYNEMKNLLSYHHDWIDGGINLFALMGFPEKYSLFFDKIKYSHQEIIDCGYANVCFRFFHGLPRLDQTLDEQMVSDFNDFQLYMARPFPHLDFIEGRNQYKKHEIDDSEKLYSIEYTFLWGRHYSFRYAYNGDVVIHGHTPTIGLSSSFYDFTHYVHPTAKKIFQKYKLESRLPFLFSRDVMAGFTSFDDFPKGGVSTFECAPWAGVEAINVDTGSVYGGGALTALGLSSERLKKGELVVVTTPTMASDLPQRSSWDPYSSDYNILDKIVAEKNEPIFRIIKIGRLGADMSFPDKNPIFPYESFRKQKPKRSIKFR
ncbi:MAG: metallophosphoesterase [Deltaproteobacteria bacterium]|jgi:predicted phosphodiesterase|nr:metallophosphoesterase [Deltaproteobacteria bacterium]